MICVHDAKDRKEYYTSRVAGKNSLYSRDNLGIDFFGSLFESGEDTSVVKKSI